MHSRFVAVTIAACCLSFSACRGKQADPSKPSPTGQATNTETALKRAGPVRLRVHSTLPDYSLTLIGDQAEGNSETLRAKKIEIRRGDATEPFQVIQGLDVETSLTSGAPGISVIDMNFDGYRDFRLMELQPAGPNVPYLNWLFDPASGRFTDSRVLNQITSPQFDSAKREIRSDWRDGPDRYGTDIYVYKQGEPVLVRKESKEYQRPGVYLSKISRLINGEWRTLEQREVKAP